MTKTELSEVYEQIDTALKKLYADEKFNWAIERPNKIVQCYTVRKLTGKIGGQVGNTKLRNEDGENKTVFITIQKTMLKNPIRFWIFEGEVLDL